MRTPSGRFAVTADHTPVVRGRHCRYYLTPHAAPPDPSGRCGESDGRCKHLAILDADVDNLHAALRWAVDRGDAQSALALCAALGTYWMMRDRYRDAVDWTGRALRLPGADEFADVRVRVLCIRVELLWPLGRGSEQLAILDEAEAAARASADPVLISHVLQKRSAMENGRGRLEQGDAFADEAMHWAVAGDDRWAIAMAAYAKAMAANTARELGQRVERAASLLEQTGNVYQLAGLLASAAFAALCIGSDRDALEFARRATPVTRDLDSRYLWMLLRGNVALVALFTGDTPNAREAFQEELTLCRELVALPFACEGLAGLAAVASIQGDRDRAARLYGAAAAHRYGLPDDPLEARLHSTFFEPARARHGAASWDAAAEEGAALNFEHAISYALETPPIRRQRPREPSAR